MGLLAVVLVDHLVDAMDTNTGKRIRQEKATANEAVGMTKEVVTPSTKAVE